SCFPCSLLSLMTLRPPCSTLFPYTTLFRSAQIHFIAVAVVARAAGGPRENKGIGADLLSIPISRECGVDLGQQPGARNRNAEERSEEQTSELQSRDNIVCRSLLEKKKNIDR